MKKYVFLLWICLLFLACNKESDDSIDNSNNETTTSSLAADDLLWGTWSFSYETNTTEGTRSYTFNQDGNYSYIDEWTVRDANGDVLSQEQDKKEGTYSVSDYIKKDSNSAEGKITIGAKTKTFSIAKNSYGDTSLSLDKIETYIKQLPTQNSNDETTPGLVADDLLWGAWNFSYVTNTIEGTRSYTFNQDGHYSYIDEWTVRDANGDVLSQEQDKKEGTYSVSDYIKKDSDSAEGIITIGTKTRTFLIAKNSYGETYLSLDNTETYTKQLPTQ